MIPKVLTLIPKKYSCPRCGQWNVYRKKNAIIEGYGRSNTCPKCSYKFSVNLAKKDDEILFNSSHSKHWCNEYSSMRQGDSCSLLYGSVKADELEYEEKCKAVYYVINVSELSCSDCLNFKSCKIRKNCLTIKLGFEYEEEEFNRAFEEDKEESQQKEKHNSQVVQEAKKDTKCQKTSDENADTIGKNKKQEEKIMANKNLKNILWEKSPKENFEAFKEWSKKYNHVLRWAVPVVSVYGAYRILNSKTFDLNVNNISDVCSKKLGMKLPFLEDKRTLKELMALGGVCATAYAAVNIASSIFKTKNADELSTEDIEKGMNQLEGVSNTFAGILPRAEKLLPVAVSVIVVYVTLHKPKLTGKWIEKFNELTADIQMQVDIYKDIIKGIIKEKFKLNLDKEDDANKFKLCMALIGIMAILGLVYGKKVLEDKKSDKEDSEKEEDINKMKKLVASLKEVFKKIAPTVYTTVISLVVSKKLLQMELPAEEIVAEAEAVEVVEAEATE